jgi:flagellar P-ring protein FlgI
MRKALPVKRSGIDFLSITLLGAIVLGTLFPLVMSAQSFHETSIGAICELKGVRGNQLLGIGILTGLDGKGDGSRSLPIKQSLSTLLNHFGIDIDPEHTGSKNSALVVVTADLPPFASPGERIDVSVSSLFEAKNVQGGVLLQTPLKSAGGISFAAAQGKVELSGKRGESSTVGAIPGGALVEREVKTSPEGQQSFSLVLDRPDYRSAAAISTAIEEANPSLEVKAVDGATVTVNYGEADIVSTVSTILDLKVSVPAPALVVIDEKSGIVVMGGDVRIAPVTVTWRGATIEVGPAGWQGDGLSGFSLDQSITVASFFQVLQDAGVRADDIISIMKVIDRAGALFGSLELM